MTASPRGRAFVVRDRIANLLTQTGRRTRPDADAHVTHTKLKKHAGRQFVQLRRREVMRRVAVYARGSFTRRVICGPLDPRRPAANEKFQHHMNDRPFNPHRLPTIQHRAGACPGQLRMSHRDQSHKRRNHHNSDGREQDVHPDSRPCSAVRAGVIAQPDNNHSVNLRSRANVIPGNRGDGRR